MPPRSRSVVIPRSSANVRRPTSDHATLPPPESDPRDADTPPMPGVAAAPPPPIAVDGETPHQLPVDVDELPPPPLAETGSTISSTGSAPLVAFSTQVMGALPDHDPRTETADAPSSEAEPPPLSSSATQSGQSPSAAGPPRAREASGSRPPVSGDQAVARPPAPQSDDEVYGFASIVDRAPTGTVRAVPARRPVAADRSRMRPYVLACVLALAVALSVAALRPKRHEIPDTPAGAQLAWILGIFNGGSYILSAELINARFAPQTIEEVGVDGIGTALMAWDARHERYTLELIETRRPRTRVAALMTTQAMDWGRIVITTEPEPPHRIIDLRVEPAQAPR